MIQQFVPFLWPITFCCSTSHSIGPHFGSLVVNRWALGLFLLLGYRDFCCWEHWHRFLSSLGGHLEVELLDQMVTSRLFNLLKSCQTVLQTSCTCLFGNLQDSFIHLVNENVSSSSYGHCSMCRKYSNQQTGRS